jgi:hypothetical protein
LTRTPGMQPAGQIVAFGPLTAESCETRSLRPQSPPPKA